MAFSNDHMHRLFEKFVLEYFKRHHTYLTEARAAQVKWNLSPETEQGMIRFLPVMQTDVFLRYREKILIIDTKYYGHTMQRRYEKATLHSDNMYQIFTYVKNRDYQFGDGEHKVSGMLLYAKTEEEIQPDNVYQIHGNQITVRTLDLNLPFAEIAGQLNAIAESCFGL